MGAVDEVAMRDGEVVPVGVRATSEASVHASGHTIAVAPRAREDGRFLLRDAFEADGRQVLPACEVARG